MRCTTEAGESCSVLEVNVDMECRLLDVADVRGTRCIRQIRCNARYNTCACGIAHVNDRIRRRCRETGIRDINDTARILGRTNGNRVVPTIYIANTKDDCIFPELSEKISRREAVFRCTAKDARQKPWES